ncbi:MAG: phosphatidate cytidylyltransferase [Treponema sp.]|nr:phosphatidate cytidylyltransferase [Treponema sp.]
MKNMAQRILVFVIGIPSIAAIVLFLPHYHHIVFNLLVVIFSGLGAAEFSAMLSHKNLVISKMEAAVFGALPPAAMILVVSFGAGDLLLSAVFAAVAAWLLLSRTFSSGGPLENFICRFAAGLAALVYPGMLLAWIVRISQWEKNAGILIFTFLLMVFSGDSLAWALGMAFGKGNQGLVPASPNKSVAGFIGGIIAPVIVGIGAVLILPDVFVPGRASIPCSPVAAGCILGLLTGIAAILGDLGESALKRSSGIKDSGSIIPGRGGVLDSIDSLALAAPVFCLVFGLLFSQS